MMIPYGYKQTEVGVIPEDWECTTAKQLMKIETGSRNTENKTNTGIYPFFVRSQKIESIDTYHYNCEAVLTAGDGVGTGKVFHYYIGKFDAHQRVYVMSGFNGISGRYFYYYFSETFEKEVSKYTAKSSVDSVRHDMIAEMKIPLPPLPEQQRIAEALSDVDGMISSLEKLVAKYKSIKTACLQQMFPQNGETVPRMRLPGFTGAWEQRKFEEIAVRSSVICSDDTLPRVEYEDIVSGAGRLNKDIYAKQSSKSGIAFHQGDVLYGKLRPYLQNWLLPTFDGLAVGDFWVLQPQNADSSFLYRLIQSRQFDEVANQSTGTKMPRADWKLVSKTVFSIPSNISEQAAIGTYFTGLDSLITLHQRKLEKIQKIKQGMMQQLLTGKIRLV